MAHVTRLALLLLLLLLLVCGLLGALIARLARDCERFERNGLRQRLGEGIDTRLGAREDTGHRWNEGLRACQTDEARGRLGQA